MYRLLVLSTYFRRFALHILIKPLGTILGAFLISFIFMSMATATNFLPSTGSLISPLHPPVSVQVQLTGQADPNSKTVNALLEVRLDDDWKTYWRSPGEGGVAPQLDWSKSANVNAVTWQWPAPKRYPVLGVDTLGYKDHIQFPITISVDDFNKETYFEARLTLASCTTICVLSDYDWMLSFNPSELQADPEIAFSYAQAVSTVPALINEQQVKTQQSSATITAIQSYWDKSTQSLQVQINNQFNWSAPDVFVDSLDPAFSDIHFSKPQINVSDTQLNVSFKASSWAGDVDLSDLPLHYTVIDKDVSVELISTSSENFIAPTSQTSIWSMFIVALLGGLILNIMPCVLPVLGMKLSTILSVQEIQRGQIRKQFLASSAGIISSFWLLAAFLLILKLSGQALGWGIQFQSPYFIAFMVIITALFAANMLGLFEIKLSSKANTWLATTGNQSLLGHYLQGMFATLLATPCSAPFLGTAVAFALGASNIELFTIFTALGLGMSLPWLLIAAFPALALLLPKPGKWMHTVKIIFALMILATCLWLLSLLASFTGAITMIALYASLLFSFSVLIIRQHGKRIFLILFSSLLLLSALVFIIASFTSRYWATPLNQELQWQKLDSEMIATHIGEGKIVFVDITADWCVTCKANKIAVLLQDPVYSALQSEKIVLMKGDWTVRSESVTTYLQSFNRYGVPFNIVYGPGSPQGIPLATILSKNEVLDAINKAQQE